MQYYVKRGEETKGPISHNQLLDLVRTKKIVSTDLIGNSADGLFHELKAVWATIKKTPVPVPAAGVHSSQQLASPAETPDASRERNWLLIGGISGFALLALVIVIVGIAKTLGSGHDGENDVASKINSPAATDSSSGAQDKADRNETESSIDVQDDETSTPGFRGVVTEDSLTKTDEKALPAESAANNDNNGGSKDPDENSRWNNDYVVPWGVEKFPVNFAGHSPARIFKELEAMPFRNQDEFETREAYVKEMQAIWPAASLLGQPASSSFVFVTHVNAVYDPETKSFSFICDPYDYENNKKERVILEYNANNTIAAELDRSGLEEQTLVWPCEVDLARDLKTNDRFRVAITFTLGPRLDSAMTGTSLDFYSPLDLNRPIDGPVPSHKTLWLKEHPRIFVFRSDTGEVLCSTKAPSIASSDSGFSAVKGKTFDSGIAIVESATGREIGTFPDKKDEKSLSKGSIKFSPSGGFVAANYYPHHQVEPKASLLTEVMSTRTGKIVASIPFEYNIPERREPSVNFGLMEMPRLDNEAGTPDHYKVEARFDFSPKEGYLILYYGSHLPDTDYDPLDMYAAESYEEIPASWPFVGENVVDLSDGSLFLNDENISAHLEDVRRHGPEVWPRNPGNRLFDGFSFDDKLFVFSDGSYMTLADRTIHQTGRKFTDSAKGWQAALLDALLSSQEEVEFDEKFDEMRERFHSVFKFEFDAEHNRLVKRNVAVDPGLSRLVGGEDDFSGGDVGMSMNMIMGAEKRTPDFPSRDYNALSKLLTKDSKYIVFESLNRGVREPLLPSNPGRRTDKNSFTSLIETSTAEKKGTVATNFMNLYNNYVTAKEEHGFSFDEAEFKSMILARGFRGIAFDDAGKRFAMFLIRGNKLQVSVFDAQTKKELVKSSMEEMITQEAYDASGGWDTEAEIRFVDDKTIVIAL